MIKLYMKSGHTHIVSLQDKDSKLDIGEFISKYFSTLKNDINFYVYKNIQGNDIYINTERIESIENI